MAPRTAPQAEPLIDDGFSRFRSSFLEYAKEADQSELDRAALESLAQDVWEFARRRAPGETKLRIHGMSGRGARRFSVLEFVTDDKPFLVASVLAELGNFDLAISWVAHPVVAVERGADGQRIRLVALREELRGLAETLPGVVRESMMQVAFEHEVDATDAAFLEDRVRKVLGDVERVVGDWEPMMSKLAETVRELESHAARLTGEAAQETNEAIAFLDWLKDNHFIFMGVRDYSRVERAGGADLEPDEDSGLGLLRDPSRRVLRRDARRDKAQPAVAAFLAAPAPITINKANFRSTVQRRVYLDYVGIKRFDAGGKAIGERRFLGLFTSAAYNRLPEDIPILRRKFRQVLERSGYSTSSYYHNVLVNILETYPRDELFQIEVDELGEIATGIMRLSERPRTRLFVRWDRFDRFVSAMVFVPRERYTAELRERIGQMLKDAFNGRVSAFYPLLGDSALVRVHFIIGRSEGARPDISLSDLEARIAHAARSWRDALHEALIETRGEEEAHLVLSKFREAFSAAYCEEFDAAETLKDIALIEKLGELPAIGIRLYRRNGDPAAQMRVKLFHRKEPITLSASLPIFEHLGLSAIKESSYQVLLGRTRSREALHLHDFLLAHPKSEALDLDALAAPIEAAFPAIWRGDAEDDGFNRLIVTAGMAWREIAVLRALARFLVQTGSSLSQSYMEETLAANPGIARRLIALFHARLGPTSASSPETRAARAETISSEIIASLEAVQSLDQDRILRRFLNLINEILRTNYYQHDEDGALRPTISFKLASTRLEGLVEPKPNVEIFVYAPRFEGVHLRFGAIARGGIRWSDRREDFRTEVLGLVKAQYVKNAVIVPVGAKGGFVPKRITNGMAREDVQAEGVACYKLFISALLDLTDNLDITRSDTAPMAPPLTVCHDASDPYLVVAADKGTATFSDIANGIAVQKRFWLGDAFASGGSNGYDHKAMAITAKGAWEAVKRHFREIGTDIQSAPFTVVGVGDMSGDVFGNGMLLSRQIKLVAAFDHRDIFIDPNPDPESSFKERERLFALPRSSWQDYDKKLISSGGGVFSRKAKSIPLSAEMRTLLGVASDAMAPFDLMRSLLVAETDLLWFGGIGTYIKARAERNGDVGDAANDAIRIDGEDVRAKVVGEGANLGCTQRGRISYAMKGGRINTDAIDNSAGVDCSDHEVNIKILLDSAVARSMLAPADRNALLKEMTGDVAAHVLIDNYDQTLALSVGEWTAKNEIDSHARLIRALEREGRLKREVERLPSEEELQERRNAGRGLTRPELAVLLAYCKIKIFDELVASSVPDEPLLLRDLAAYFPAVMERRFPSELRAHRLHREIIATGISNQMVNLGGVNFASRLKELAGVETPAVARAFIAVREVFDILALRARINALDGKISSALQLSMHTRLRTFLRRQSVWFLRRGEQALGDLAALVARYKPRIAELKSALADVSSAFIRGTIKEVEAELVKGGVPMETAYAVASLEPLFSAGDIVNLALESGVPIRDAARAQALIGEATGLERLNVAAIHLTSEDHWERLAIRRVVEDLSQQQASLAVLALSGPGGAHVGHIDSWLARNAAELTRISAAFAELEAGSGLSAARLSLASGHLRDLLIQAAAKSPVSDGTGARR